MKKYLTPMMEIKSFAAENVVTTGSAGVVDNWNTENNLNAQSVDWNGSSMKDVSGVISFNN